jgi:DNA-binding MarR family transcriptional regulator
MTTITNLTELETKVLNTLVDSMYAEWGFSDCGFKDISKQLDLDTKILRGVVGSLVKKELVQVEKSNGFEDTDIIYLINAAEGLVPSWVEESEGKLEASQIVNN